LVIEAEEKVRVLQENLRVAQSWEKSYFDKRRKPLQFEVGDHVYLRVSPTKGVPRFGVRGKLAPNMLVLMKSPKFADPWPIECNYPLHLQPSMISFMFLNSRSVFEF
jgi:hypothetical protein